MTIVQLEHKAKKLLGWDNIKLMSKKIFSSGEIIFVFDVVDDDGNDHVSIVAYKQGKEKFYIATSIEWGELNDT